MSRGDLRLIPSGEPTALQRADAHFAEARADASAAAMAIFADLDRLADELRGLAERPEPLTSAAIRDGAPRLAGQIANDVARMRISLRGRIR